MYVSHIYKAHGGGCGVAYVKIVGSLSGSLSNTHLSISALSFY